MRTAVLLTDYTPLLGAGPSHPLPWKTDRERLLIDGPPVAVGRQLRRHRAILATEAGQKEGDPLRIPSYMSRLPRSLLRRAYGAFNPSGYLTRLIGLDTCLDASHHQVPKPQLIDLTQVEFQRVKDW